MRLRFGIAALAVLLAAAGCGGGGGSSDLASVAGADTAATIAPATAAFYASVNTDVESEQWEELNALLDRFPGSDRLLQMVLESLQEEGVDWEQDVKPALGPTVEVVGLDFESEDEGFVFLVQPADKAKFEQLLEQGDEPAFTRELEGWTVAATSEAALDRFEQALGADEKLADDEVFDELMGELPEQALVKAFVDGEQATRASAQLGGGQAQLAFGRLTGLAFAAEAAEDGLAVLVRSRAEDVELDVQEWGDLAELVPADALAFVNAHGQDGQLKVTEQIRATPAASAALGQFEQLLGVTLEEVATLFEQELLLWVRPGTVIPEVTLVLEVEDEAAARATVDDLVEAAGSLGGVQSRPRQVGDVDATEVDLGQFALLYATVDGKLVVTTQASGIEAAAGEVDDRLVDSDAYEESIDAAGVPGDEHVLLWVDLARAIALVDTFTSLAGEEIPADVRANLEPLRTIVMSANADFENASGRMFLHVR